MLLLMLSADHALTIWQLPADRQTSQFGRLRARDWTHKEGHGNVRREFFVSSNLSVAVMLLCRKISLLSAGITFSSMAD